MRKTSRILKTELWGTIALTLLVVLLFESDTLAAGIWAADEGILFVTTALMEVITVGLVPLALYLFRIPRIHTELTSGKSDVPARLLFWGTLRMDMIGVPLFLNTLFYYFSGHVVSFFYMAVILGLCLILIYPSLNRCLSETQPDSPEQS